MNNQEHRQDWHLTSTGVGHYYRPGYYFPASTFLSLYREPVPPELARKDEVPRDSYYYTTTGDAHDRKFFSAPYGQEIYKKAPGHWKVNYVKDLAEKLGKGGYRRPLTMCNQKSETKDEFSGRPGIKDTYEFDPRPKPFTLNDHHNDGPTKYGVASTQNQKLRGRPFFVRDKGILNELDPYLSTTQRDHRSFKPAELKGYPAKDIATYWQCEEYPKAWGFGTKDNPIPKDSVPREPLPMVDSTWFKSRTKVINVPRSAVPVPHSGLRSEKQDNYTRPSDVKMKEIYYCPVDSPYAQQVPGPPGPSSAFAAPHMYKTEYQNVGSKKTITV